MLFLFAQIRKTRSLTELINEAEETLSNPINQVSMGCHELFIDVLDVAHRIQFKIV